MSRTLDLERIEDLWLRPHDESPRAHLDTGDVRDDLDQVYENPQKNLVRVVSPSRSNARSSALS